MGTVLNVTYGVGLGQFSIIHNYSADEIIIYSLNGANRAGYSVYN